MKVALRFFCTSARVASPSAQAFLIAATAACVATYIGGPKFETNGAP